MLNARAERSLLFKIMLGWIYLSFFCVQLHLKYVVSFDVISHTAACSIEKQDAGKHVVQSENIPVKIRLNKRYQPEPFYAVYPCLLPSPALQTFNVPFQEDIYPVIHGGFSLQLSLRGPPAC